MNTNATRRRALLTLVIGLLAVTTGAHAQTSSTSSSSTSSSTSTTSSTTSTTAPLVVVLPCPASGCTEQPPTAFLRSASGEVAGAQGSSCWSKQNGSASCVDSVFLDPSPVLTVRPGERLSLRFATEEQPAEVAVHVHNRFESPLQPKLVADPLTIASANPVTFQADTGEGMRWLVVETRWLQGSSLAFFKVRVVPVATATPARLGITG